VALGGLLTSQTCSTDAPAAPVNFEVATGFTLKRIQRLTDLNGWTLRHET
jgi:hypothetical protein